MKRSKHGSGLTSISASKSNSRNSSSNGMIWNKSLRRNFGKCRVSNSKHPTNRLSVCLANNHRYGQSKTMTGMSIVLTDRGGGGRMKTQETASDGIYGGWSRH